MDKWKLLVKAAIAGGFVGSSVSELKAWAFENNVEKFSIGKDQHIDVEDIDSVYKSCKKVTLTIDDEEGEDEIIDNRGKAGDDEIDDDDDDLTPAGKAARKAERKARAKEQESAWFSANSGGDDEMESKARKSIRGGNAAERLRNIQECKRYNTLAARGVTHYNDSDIAEAHTAKTRLEMAGISLKYDNRQRDEEIVKYWTKAGGVYDATLGGLLIPTTYNNNLIDHTPGYGTARDTVGVYPMDTQKEVIPRTGDMVKFGLVGEGVESPTTQPNFNGVYMDAREVSGLIVLPVKLFNQSAISMADFLRGNVDNAKRYYEDQAFWNGINAYTDTVEWPGLKQRVGTNQSKTVGSLSSVAGLTLTNLLEWLSELPDEVDQYENDIAIYCHRSFDEMTFQRFVGTAGGAQETDITQKPRRSFNGIPIKHVNVLPRSAFVSGTTYAYVGPLKQSSKMAQVNGSETYAESEHRYIEKRQWCSVVSFQMALNHHDANNNAAADVASGDARASLIRGLRVTS